jgi:O-antigen/teichoic acid export membrane protein
MDRKTHKTKTISGLKWNILNQIVSQVISLGIGIMLARLLSPKEFGLIGMIMVFSGFLHVFDDFGLGSALIQKKDIKEIDKNTVFWANLIMGVFLMLIMMGLSFFISRFYESPILKPLSLLLSLNFVIHSLNYVQNTLLKKSMQFGKLFIVNLTTTIFSGALAIVLALNGFGVWSLAWQSISIAVTTTLALWLISDWRPGFSWSKDSFKELMCFSLPLLGTQSFQYWNRNTDNLLIGKFLGEEALGYYTRAYNLMLFPVRRISGVISSVMFPSFALIQDDKKRVTKIFITSIRYLSFITFPLMGTLFIAADHFVYVVLGSQWEKSIELIQVLCWVGALQSVSTLNGNIFLAYAKTRLHFKLNSVLGIFIIGSMAVGLRFGIIGVAVSYLGATFITGFVLRKFIADILEVRITDLIIPLLPSAAYTLVTTVITYFVSVYFLNDQYNFVNLFAKVLISFGLYFILMVLFSRGDLLAMLANLKRDK